jgi:hypothetical protein
MHFPLPTDGGVETNFSFIAELARRRVIGARVAPRRCVDYRPHRNTL